MANRFQIELDTLSYDDEQFQAHLKHLGITSEKLEPQIDFDTVRYTGTEEAIKKLLVDWFEDPELFDECAVAVD